MKKQKLMRMDMTIRATFMALKSLFIYLFIVGLSLLVDKYSNLVFFMNKCI